MGKRHSELDYIMSTVLRVGLRHRSWRQDVAPCFRFLASNSTRGGGGYHKPVSADHNKSEVRNGIQFKSHQAIITQKGCPTMNGISDQIDLHEHTLVEYIVSTIDPSSPWRRISGTPIYAEIA